MLSTFVTTIIVNCVCPDWRCWSPTVHHSICAWNSVAWTMFYWVAFTTAAVTLVVVVVVVVFIAASAQPANSTRVITCCSSSQSCLDHKITLTSLPACVAAACTYAFHRNSVALATVGLMQWQSQASRCTKMMFLVRYSQGCAHPLLRSASFSPETCLPQPQSVVLTGVLLSLSSWRYTLRYMSSHSRSHTCQRHPHSCHHSH